MVDILHYIISAAVVALLVIAILRTIPLLHMLQLEGYKNKRFIKWLVTNPAKVLIVRPIKEPKKKLVFTARATRLFVLFLVLLAFMTYYLFTPSPLFIVTGILICFCVPFLIILSNVLIHPLEAVINNLYLKSAKKKVQMLKPKVIAITGSYGKTSTKDFLATILSKRYKVLKTPGSFNTPMGICKVIRGELKPEHEIFIVEMGAKEKGDIKDLCDLVRPEIGIITAIGPQHLETFRTMESVVSTKYELIESLPVEGIAVLNNDDENCRNLVERTKEKQVLLFGINRDNRKLHLTANNISTDSNGIYFMAQNCKAITVSCHCKLLGRHNINNILAAATVALKLGMSLDEIAEAIKTLEPTPHRLQLIRGAGGVIVIDDAFNANPVGARMALEVLDEFKGGGKKVLVTPGLVELGEKDYEENKQLGIIAANVCDFVFLVGPKRTRPVFDGLKEAGFPEASVYVERNLKAVTERFKSVLKAGDIVLFENDLPDTYNE
ncbi:MAG: UDP-N-acetylmuramoyl-tripeptide--D-alanyl-D-alanine ligase [Candidatus Scalindua sp.]|nr:UDP-N-acetylmuramoyl-tripeptide--D-alanyl-D-alanine ligase [Candidatus Scalindua sp.]MCR4345353.1 UDP-N-acetylmuramoyl-tripeptide--D-alanyl-D-alanine ligase [Candidatus Scalindua sp.]